MARGIISRCPCGACRCISFTDDEEAVSMGWFHGDTELTFWEGAESPADAECPECHASLTGLDLDAGDDMIGNMVLA